MWPTSTFCGSVSTPTRPSGKGFGSPRFQLGRSLSERELHRSTRLTVCCLAEHANAPFATLQGVFTASVRGVAAQGRIAVDDGSSECEPLCYCYLTVRPHSPHCALHPPGERPPARLACRRCCPGAEAGDPAWHLNCEYFTTGRTAAAQQRRGDSAARRRWQRWLCAATAAADGCRHT